MDFLAVIALPLLLALLAGGGGLLVDRVAGNALPGVLVLPVGLAALIAVGELTTYWSATAPLTPWALVALAAFGYVAGRKRLVDGAPDLAPVLAFAAVSLLVLLPVLLAGRATLPGYLLDTTVAFHTAVADFLVDHSRDYGVLPESSYRSLLQSYSGDEYPSGAQALLGGLHKITGVDALWLYQPLLAVLLAFCGPSIFFMARGAGMKRWPAAMTAVIASVPALVYSYAQMGAIKEIAVLPLIMLLGALLMILPRLLNAGPRGAVPIAVVAAAGMAAIGVAFTGWLAPVLLIGLVLAVSLHKISPRRLVPWAAVLGIVSLVLAIPTIGPLSSSVRLASNLSADNAAFASDPGNLVRPLLPAQVAGVWLGGSHRHGPKYLEATWALIGFTAMMTLLGVAYAVRRRLWPLVAFAGMMAVVWLVLTRRGTDWTDAKLLVVTSPTLVLFAAIGIESLRHAGRRLESLTAALVLAGGILASNALIYHDTNLLPTDRFREALAIGERYAGDGPALLPEFDEFALYALRETAPSGPGFSQRGPVLTATAGGGPFAYSESYDLDGLQPSEIASHKLIIRRRRPDVSVPPSNYHLDFQGNYYEVWRQTGPEPPRHLPAGGVGAPLGAISCAHVRSAAARARRADAVLAVPDRVAPVVVRAESIKDRPTGWVPLNGLALLTPGRAQKRVTVSTGGRYRVWLSGDIARPLRISINGRKIGDVGYQSGNAGNFAQPLEAELEAGKNVLAIERAGGGMAPGDGSFSRLGSVVLEPVQSDANGLASVAPKNADELCGRLVDWIEIASPGVLRDRR